MNEHQILLADGVRGSEMHHSAKFRQIASIGCGDIAIFRFFKMAAAVILDFRNSQILLADGFWSAKMHHRAKFRQNTSIVELVYFFIFQDGNCRHLGF